MNEIYEARRKRIQKLSKQKTIKREDLKFLLDILSLRVGVESFSRVLDFMEDLGFERNLD